MIISKEVIIVHFVEIGIVEDLYEFLNQFVDVYKKILANTHWFILH